MLKKFEYFILYYKTVALDKMLMTHSEVESFDDKIVIKILP